MAVSEEAKKRIVDIYQNQPQGFASEDVVESLYQDILGRGADPGGLEYYQKFPAHIAAQRMYNSPEARQKESFAPRPGYDYSLSEEEIAASGNSYLFAPDGMYKQFQDPNQKPEDFADIRAQFGYPHVQAIAALRDRISMRAEGDNRAFSRYEQKRTGQSESEFNKFTSYVDRLESLYNQGYSINDINELGSGNLNVTPSFNVGDQGAGDEAADSAADSAPPANATEADLQSLYQELLGGPARPEAVEYWMGQGMTVDSLRNAIAQSPEGLEYASTGTVSPQRQAYIDSLAGDTTTGTGTTPPPSNDVGTNPVGANPVNTTDYSSDINRYYRELFGRQAGQPGIDYFSDQLAQGNIDPNRLREALAAGAKGDDLTYYQASQQGGPLFDATQQLFGRSPTQEGFFDFRPGGDPFTGDTDQLRRTLVRQAYGRGDGTGTSRDYQNYLNTLGIDRANSPFAIDGGFANVPYGGDLSSYQAGADQGTGGGMPNFPPYMGGGGKGGKGGAPRQRGTGGTYQAGGFGGRMPGQFATGNQLYSGMVPYGMTSPMGGFGGGFGGGGKGGGFGSPYGMSQQYMPNRGLMSGYSTGFGPYGGFQRPRFGGGKGGRQRIQPFPYQAGGKGGYGMYGGGYGQPTGQSYEDVVRAGGGGINPVIGPNGERLTDRRFFDSDQGNVSFDPDAVSIGGPTQQPTFDQNLQFILDQVAAGTATPGQQKFYDERYLTGEYLNNPSNFG